MSSKWNERLVINFLKTYKQHPCLWNPYHKDYYNCREKNEALQMIIDHLNIPGFTVTDYLHQIKSIREKYKEEQIRTIKSLQSQKQYKSPFSWYNVVADMLMKVIDDEKKAYERETSSTLRSLSSGNIKNLQRRDKAGTDSKFLKIEPCNNETCDQTFRRSKSVEKPSILTGKRNITGKGVAKEKSEKRVKYVPCPQFSSQRDDSGDRKKDVLLSYKPTKDTDSGVLEYMAPIPSAFMDSKHIQPLPSIRESGKSMNSGIDFRPKSADKSYEPPFLKCPSCGWEDAKYEGDERIGERGQISCSRYNKNLPTGYYSSCTGCDTVSRDVLPHRFEEDINLPELYGNVDYTKNYLNYSGDFNILQDSPKPTNYIDLTRKCLETEKIKSQVNVGMQVSEEKKEEVSASTSTKTQIIQVEPTISSKLQYGTIEASTQLKIILSEPEKLLKLDDSVTEKIQQKTQGVQSTKADHSSKETQFSSRGTVPEGVNTNVVNYAEKEVQNTVYTSDGTKRCVSLQTVNQTEEEGKEEEKKKLKDVGVNVVDKISRGIQGTVCVSRGNLVRCASLEKMVEIGTSMSLHRVRSIGCVTMENCKEVQSKFVQCVPTERLLKRSKSFGTLTHCMRDKNLKQTADKETQEFEAACTTDTCPLNILTLAREDSAVASALQQFLRSILFEYLRSEERRKQMNQGCMIGEPEIMNVIKEHTMRMLDSEIPKEILQKDKTKPKCFIHAETSTIHDGKSTMTKASMFEPIFQSTGMKKDESQRITEEDRLGEKRKLSVVDKEVCVKSNCKDAGTNGSSSHLQSPFHDVEIQSSSQLLKDSVCVSKYEKDVGDTVSIGTQKRDPILVRVIKCMESQAIVRSDKETCTGIDFERERSCKRVITCGRPTCILPTVCGTLNETSLKYCFKEKQVPDGYCRHSTVFEDEICDKDCKTQLPYDWTDVTDIDAFSNVTSSKIPRCVRSRKYTYARSK